MINLLIASKNLILAGRHFSKPNFTYLIYKTATTKSVLNQLNYLQLHSTVFQTLLNNDLSSKFDLKGNTVDTLELEVALLQKYNNCVHFGSIFK